MLKVVPELVRGHKIATTFKKVLSHREAILYALSVGSHLPRLDKEEEFSDCNKFTYENYDFQVVQSFSAQFSVLELMDIKKAQGLPDYDPMALLHGEQIIKFTKPSKIGQSLRTNNVISDIADKKSGALLTIESSSVCDKTDELLVRNYAKLFIRGIGGFGDPGKPTENDTVKYPKAKSEKVIDSIALPTSLYQAHFYRISSEDVNPLHVDPKEAAKGGFKRPILHGLCSLGYSTAAFQRLFDQHSLKTIACRFTAPTYPGNNFLINFYESEVANQILFETISYEDDKTKGFTIAKGFFETA